MTLKEKFEEIEDLGRFSDSGYSTWSTKVLDKQSTECVKIADDFAIGFEEWANENKQFNKSKTNKELLEIYKKEKGL